MSSLPDETLVRRWGDGDETAGQELVVRYFDLVFRFFAARLGESTSDLVQATFLACIERRADSRPIVSFRAFVLGVARKLFLDHLRKGGRRERAMAARAHQPEPSIRSAGARIQLQQEQHVLLRALRRLPIDLQLALELHYWEELSTAEIAAVLEIPRGTVLSRLHRARQLLLGLVEQDEEGARDAITATTRELERWARSLRGTVMVDDA